VQRDCGALVGSLGHVARVFRVDPDRVIVVAARASAEDRAMSATLVATAHRLADEIDDVGVSGIDGDAVEVIAREGLFGIHTLPAGAAVVRAPKAAVRLGIDHCIDANLAAAAGGGEADPAEWPGRPAAAGEATPMGALVVRPPDAASGPGNLGEIALPRPLPGIPGRGEKGARVGGIADDVVGAGEPAGRDRVAPRLAAVGRPIDSPRIASAEKMADGSN